MPYKDPGRKRQWEQEHREQRNARRRMERLPVWSGGPSAPKAAHDPAYVAQQAILLARLRKRMLDPVSDQKPGSAWRTLLGWAVGIGIVLLAAMSGLNLPPPGDLGLAGGSGRGYRA